MLHPVYLPLIHFVGKVALVTGSSKSTGAAIARSLAAQGASVVVNYSSDNKAAEEVAQQINGTSATSSAPRSIFPSDSTDPGTGNGHNDQHISVKQQAITVKADSSTIAGGKYLLQETLRVFGRLDILVLNAGLMGGKTLGEIDEEFFDAHFAVNVKAPLFLVKAAAEVMERRERSASQFLMYRNTNEISSA